MRPRSSRGPGGPGSGRSTRSKPSSPRAASILTAFMMPSLGLSADTDAGYARLAQAAATEILPNRVDAELAEAGAACGLKIQDKVVQRTSSTLCLVVHEERSSESLKISVSESSFWGAQPGLLQRGAGLSPYPV